MGLTNLPVQLTSFIGREREIADIQRLLSTSRLVTLTGAGGSGKTRLASQIANTITETFADGLWFVDLAPLREPALLPIIVADVLGLRLAAGQPPLETLVDFVRPKQLLLILDNCEHLRDACADLARELLSQSPLLRVLVTSREPLAIAGEMVYPIHGLAWPPIDAKLEDIPQSLKQYDAIRLFVERARAISPDFDLTSENARATAEICRRLDGLPLALELASARVNVLTVQEIAKRLNDRLALLISSQRTGIEPRHQTLRAAIDWSYMLLPMDEQILLRRLAVFEAGCTLDTAEAICAGEGVASDNILDRLSSLVSKSLVVADTIGRAQARYRLLETIREYALWKLDEAGETRRLHDCHLDLFLDRAEEAEPKLNDTYQRLWLNWLEGENDNLRAALAWSLESGRIEEGLRIAIALLRYWEIRGYVKEGLGWYQRLLARADKGVSLAVHVNALAGASFLAMFSGDAQSSMAYGRQAVALAEAAGDESSSVLVMALAGLASGARVAGDHHTAYNLEERAIQLLRKMPEQPFALGMALLSHGSSAIELGDYDTAHASLNESLEIARQAGDAFRIAHSLNVLGDLARCEHKYAAAKTAYENSAVYLREIGAQHDLASILHNLGHTYLHLGDIEHAHILFRESMAAHQSLQNEPGMAECLIGFAAIALLRELPAVGARLLGASAAGGGKRVAIASVWQATRLEYEQYLELAQKRLTKAEFQSEYEAGGAMSLEHAVDYAMNFPLKLRSALENGETPGDLTGREREVATFISQGKTNSEIATELVVSKRTVETHVSHILSKLGLSNRSQIMRWAIDHGLKQKPT